MSVVIDKSKAKKKQTIKGTDNDDIITGSKYADKIYTGTGNDTINPGKGKDTIYINGYGDKDIYLGTNTGSNKIVFQYCNNFDTTLHFDDNHNEYLKKGNDLIIRHYIYNSSNGKHTYDKADTIVDYFSDSNNIDKTALYIKKENSTAALLENNIYALKVYGDKKRNVVGTDYSNNSLYRFDDYLYGSAKADKISTGAGKDYIYAGKGNDNIQINGDGLKKFLIYNGDGNDTINCTSITERIALETDCTNVLSYERQDNDLILYRTFDNKKKIVTEKTVFSYLYQTDEEEDTLYIGDDKFSEAKLYMATNGIETRKGNFNVTSADEGKIIKGNAKKNVINITGVTTVDTSVFAGAGNDIINISDSSSARINGGAGKDTININDNITGTVVINHATGDGNDTIVANSNAQITINLSLQGKAFKNHDYYSDYFIYGRMGFRKSGNDLVFQIPSAKSKFETITFKDYYSGSSKFNSDNITFNFDANQENWIQISEHGNSKLSNKINQWAFWVNGSYNKSTKTTTYIYEEDRNNYFEYKGKGKAIMIGSGEDDTYLVKLTNKSNLYINDLGKKYGSDILIQKNMSSLRMFFNIDTNGNVGVTSNTNSDNLFIFDSKKSLTAKNLKNILSGKNGTGVLNINNYFEAKSSEDSYYTAGSGNATVFASKTVVDNRINDYIYWWKDIVSIENLVSSISADVASWLTQKGYTDSLDVMDRGSSKDVAKLLSFYTADKPISTH